MCAKSIHPSRAGNKRGTQTATRKTRTGQIAEGSRSLTQRDTDALTALAARLLGRWRCELQKDERGDVRAVVGRVGTLRNANRFIVIREGQELCLVATRWPVAPVTLGVYRRMANLTSYLSRAVGLKAPQGTAAEPKRPAMRRRRGQTSDFD